MVVKRRLAALLSADVAGYSGLVRDHEEAAIAVLRGHRAISDRLIEQYGGRIANTAGDSVLAEFDSPVEAVRCALEVQEALGTRNAALAEAERMWFRIGINLGDVMVQENGDLLGDGVNIAARLQALAEPGGVCISNSMREQIENKVALAIDDLGDQMVKNIPQPVRVYRLRKGDGAAAPSGRPVRRRRWLAAAAAGILAICLAGVAWYRVAAPDARRFTGEWPGEYSCSPPGADPAAVPAFVIRLVAIVRDGELVIARGQPGNAGYFDVKGRIAADGAITASGQGVNPAGPYTVALSGRAEDDHMTLTGLINGRRPCRGSFTRTKG
jgi:class 3 adenylate cyclase